MIQCKRRAVPHLQLLSATLMLCAGALVATDADAQATQGEPRNPVTQPTPAEPATTVPFPAEVPDSASNDRGAMGPMVQRQGDVAYVSGGISEGGKAETIALGRDMNLQMVFAQVPGGNYVAQVDVAVADSSGNTVLELDSSGPLLFARLEPGRYEATATAQGKTVRRSFEVPAQGQHTERFIWKATPG